MVGYGVVVVLLAGGMLFTTQRFDGIARRHVARIHAEVNHITLAERMRWTAEAIVSAGQGYLISRDPVFLASIQGAQTQFDRGIQALAQDPVDANTSQLVSDIEGAAIAFRRHQEALLVEAMRADDLRALANRFEVELVPLQRQLGASLARLIDYEESGIEQVYHHVAGERARLRTSVTVLLAILVVASLGIAAAIARLLARSSRKEQQALETSRKALAARDEILGVVAHDLRNPLASIAMRAALLRETAESAETEKHAEKIERVTRRMASLINSLLDLATIEAGHFTVRPEACAVDELIDASLETLAALAAQKQIRLEHPPFRGTAMVRADRERVLQVLQNLVGNAIKFTPEGGRVIIAADREADVVRFRVSDTGPGIASAHRPHVFDRFWKHEVGGTRGTGLGLFIAKGIIEAHRGRIWVESVPGQGSTFCFTLPAIEAAVADTETEPGTRMLMPSAQGARGA